MKWERSNQQAWDCKAPLRAKPSPFPVNANQEPVQKKKKFDKGDLKITELGSEKDSENE